MAPPKNDQGHKDFVRKFNQSPEIVTTGTEDLYTKYNPIIELSKDKELMTEWRNEAIRFIKEMQEYPEKREKLRNWFESFAKPLKKGMTFYHYGESIYLEVFIKQGAYSYSNYESLTEIQRKKLEKINAHLVGGEGLYLGGDPWGPSVHYGNAAATIATDKSGVSNRPLLMMVRLEENEVPLLDFHNQKEALKYN